MKLGELFFDLGVTGSDKSIGAVSGLRNGLKETASVGLETKAAIVGVLYSLQQLFSASNQRGTDLVNFNAVLGMSTKTLQQYQYAARQVGVSNGEMENTFKGLQKSMTDIKLNGKAPSGMAFFTEALRKTGKGVTADSVDIWSRNPEILLQDLQAAMAEIKDVGVRNEVLGSFGLGDGMKAALARNAFRPEVLDRAPVYSDSQNTALDANRAKMANIFDKFEMSVGKLNAKYGGKLLDDIDKIITKVLQLSEAFIKLADQLKLFEWVGKMFEGWGMIFDEINTASKDLASDGPSKSMSVQFAQSLIPKQMDTEKRTVGDEFNFLWEFLKQKKYEGVFDKTGIKSETVGPGLLPNVKPTMPAVSPKPPSEPVRETTVNQTLNFQNDGKDARAAADNNKAAARNAFRQLPQAQGN